LADVAEGDATLSEDANAVQFLMDASRHCKAIGWNGIDALAQKAGITAGPGLVDLNARHSVKDFVEAAAAGRFWEREPI
jgi:hypothetical protein